MRADAVADDADLAGAIGRAVLDAAAVGAAGPVDVDAHLRVVSSAARAESESRALLQRSVESARAGGASWSRVGSALGMSRQAAQQRFGVRPRDGELPATERWLGPATVFDELPELEAAGRLGWRTVEAGMLAHRMVRTDTQWEHRRILWRASLEGERRAGWEVGCRAFPWIYLVRDRGRPPVVES